jgi:hypothetical protein
MLRELFFIRFSTVGMNRGDHMRRLRAPSSSIVLAISLNAATNWASSSGPSAGRVEALLAAEKPEAVDEASEHVGSNGAANVFDAPPPRLGRWLRARLSANSCHGPM